MLGEVANICWSHFFTNIDMVAIYLCLKDAFYNIYIPRYILCYDTSLSNSFINPSK